MFTAAKGKENIGSRFGFNPVTNYTEANTAVQCLQCTTVKTPVSSNIVRTACFGNRLPISEAPVLLKSNRSKILAGLASHSSTESSGLGKTFSAFDPTIAGTGAKPKLLNSNRSHRLAGFTNHPSTESSELGKTYPAVDPAIVGTSEIPNLLNSNRSHRLADFTNHPSTESTELKTFPAPDSKGKGGINYARKCLTYDTLQRSAIFRDQYATESNEFSKELTSALGVMGTFDASKFLESQRVESYVSQNKSDKSSKVMSQCVGTHSLSSPFLYKSNNLQGILGVTSQNEMESNISGVALVYNYGELETKEAPVLTHNQLQSHESFTQPHGTDRIHHTTATETSTVLKSKIPLSVTRFVKEDMKSCEEVGNIPSLCHPTTNKQCNGMPFHEFLLMREKAPSKLDAREWEKPIANSRKSKLPPCVESMLTPLLLSSSKSCTFTNFTNPEGTNKTAVIPSEERDNISACYTGRTTTECSWPRISQPVKFSGFSSSIDRTTVVTGSKRKRSTEESIDRHVCIPSKSPFNQQNKDVNCGEPDEADTKPSLLCNVTESRFSEKSLEANNLAELMVPNIKKLNMATECASSWKTCADEVPIVKLPNPSEPKVPLSKKALSTSANETNSMQNINTENSTTQNSSVFVFQGNELHDSSKMVPSSADSSVCVKSAIEKLAALCKKQEEDIQAVLKQTNVIYNEMVKILNMFGSEQEDRLNNDSTEREKENHVSDVSLACVCKDSDISSRHFISTPPLRRSARIAAQVSGAESKSLPATPTRLEGRRKEDIDYPSAKSHSRCSAVKLKKSATVYKDLRSSFRFLKTPQSTRHSHARTPKNTPTRILSQRLQDQILSLYD
jgi:NACalpha-BTF3-like transcription factor